MLLEPQNLHTAERFPPPKLALLRTSTLLKTVRPGTSPRMASPPPKPPDGQQPAVALFDSNQLWWIVVSMSWPVLYSESPTTSAPPTPRRALLWVNRLSRTSTVGRKPMYTAPPLSSTLLPSKVLWLIDPPSVKLEDVQ